VASFELGAAQVEVAQQRDLGAVVDDLAVDVQDQLGEGPVGERPSAGPTGLASAASSSACRRCPRGGHR
jgi:hypothetical protein